MKIELVAGPSEVIMENIRQANLRKYQDRVRAAIKAKDAKPADSRTVASFLDMWHNSRSSQ
jgi:hypothetical protein